jgi:hypothetical protein
MEASSAGVVDSLFLETASGQQVEARIVRYGEKFGPGGTYLNTGAQPIVEFRRVGVSPAIAYMNSYHVDFFESIPLDVRFSPDGSLKLALPLGEVHRLVEWLRGLGLLDELL